MRLNEGLLAAADRAGAALAGSLLAWPGAERLEIAQELVRRGRGVHADVLDGSFPRTDGVRVDQLDRLVGSAGERLDVHLMVEDPVELLPTLPDGPYARLTVHLTPRNSLSRLPRVGARSLWLSLEPTAWTGPEQEALLERVLDVHRPDGVLVMLAPPGVPDALADLSALQSATWRQAAARGPVGVDGGVSRSNLRAAVGAGATYLVAGRALSSRARWASRRNLTTNGGQ